ncbi:MAG: ABC transporter substrate-binding protein [Reyranellaceae bacterium]
MRRRSLVAGIGSVVATPSGRARAQGPSLPVIGLLATSSAEAPAGPVEAIRLGLKQAGYEVGAKVRLEYRYADNQPDRLPGLARELAALPVDVIVTSGGPAATLAAKAATTSIPIVFAPVSDPVRVGLVQSLNRPGGNVTGVAALTIELDPKRLELLAEFLPDRGPLGFLCNPARPDSEAQIESIRTAARALGKGLVLAQASTPDELAPACEALARGAVVSVLVGADAFFSSRRQQVVSLVARHRWPAVFQWREFVDLGGLASFGPSLFDAYRQTGLFAARILAGEKPANLPVQQPTKFEFVLNLRTARALGLAVPVALLSRADDVIE